MEKTINEKTMNIKTTIFILLAFSYATAPAYTSPVVIYDNGKTIDAQQFYAFKKPSLEAITKNISSYTKNISIYSKQSIPRFPVISKMLSVGKVYSRTIKSNTPTIPRAICILGDDLYSKHWLQANVVKLKALNALCMIVNVDSRDSFKAIQQLAPKIEFAALNGDIFSQTYNIKHYPFLLNKGFITQ